MRTWLTYLELGLMETLHFQLSKQTSPQLSLWRKLQVTKTYLYVLNAYYFFYFYFSIETGLEDSMGHFGHTAGHTDDGYDEGGLTCMISNSRIPEEYEPGRFHLFGSGMYIGVEVLPDATRLMIVLYCPRAALSPDGISMPLASLPNR